MTTKETQPAAPEQQAAITVTPASVIPSGTGKYVDALAFETIAQGQPVAIVDPLFALASASGLPTVRLADATTQYKVVGLAANAASAGQPVKVVTQDPNMAISGVVAGDVLMLGVTSGALTVTPADITAGKYMAVIGVGMAAGKINMSIIRADNPK